MRLSISTLLVTLLVLLSGIAHAKEPPAEDPLGNLIEQLDSEDWRERVAAQNLLLELEPAYFQDLLGYLNHTSPEVRWQVRRIAENLAETPEQRLMIFKSHCGYELLKKLFRNALNCFINHEPLDKETTEAYVLPIVYDGWSAPWIAAYNQKSLKIQMSSLKGTPPVSINRLWADISTVAITLAWEAAHTYGHKADIGWNISWCGRINLKNALGDITPGTEDMATIVAMARAKGDLSFNTFEKLMLFLNIPDVDSTITFQHPHAYNFWKNYNQIDRMTTFLILCDMLQDGKSQEPPAALPKSQEDALKQVLDGKYLQQIGQRLHFCVLAKTQSHNNWNYSFPNKEHLNDNRNKKNARNPRTSGDCKPQALDYVRYQQGLYKIAWLLDRTLMRIHYHTPKNFHSRPIDQSKLPCDEWQNSKAWCRLSDGLNKKIIQHFEKCAASDRNLFRAATATISCGANGRLSSEATDMSLQDKAAIIARAIENSIRHQKELMESRKEDARGSKQDAKH